LQLVAWLLGQPNSSNNYKLKICTKEREKNRKTNSKKLKKLLDL